MVVLIKLIVKLKGWLVDRLPTKTHKEHSTVEYDHIDRGILLYRGPYK